MSGSKEIPFETINFTEDTGTFTYSYDSSGNLTTDTRNRLQIQNNVLNLPMSPYNYCGNDPVNMVNLYGKQPVNNIDSNGNKRISWSVVIMVEAPKQNLSARRMERYEKNKQSLADNYQCQFNHYLNGDGEGALNTSGERVLSTFEINVVDV
ncbi:MAG: hypothetical protein MJY50_03310 [Bacteroidales bacterium]|nr:hypothetical protein [Bacteroidales bacterium]